MQQKFDVNAKSKTRAIAKVISVQLVSIFNTSMYTCWMKTVSNENAHTLVYNRHVHSMRNIYNGDVMLP
jgi:hypothetical protein